MAWHKSQTYVAVDCGGVFPFGKWVSCPLNTTQHHANDVYRSSWVNIYTTYFLEIAQVKQPFQYSILVTCTGLIGVLTSFFFVRLIDRRTVMLVGISACAICQLVPAIAWTKNPGTEETGKVVVAFIALFTFFYVAYGMLLTKTSEKRGTRWARLTSVNSTIRLAPRR